MDDKMMDLFLEDDRQMDEWREMVGDPCGKCGGARVSPSDNDKHRLWHYRSSLAETPWWRWRKRRMWRFVISDMENYVERKGESNDGR